MSSQIRNAFTDAILLDDVYFETGVYNIKLCMYESMQIDHILITSKGVLVLEDKYIGLDISVFLIIVIGGIARDKIRVQQFIDAKR